MPRYDNDDKELNFTITKVKCLIFQLSCLSSSPSIHLFLAVLDNTVQGLAFSASDSYYFQTFVEFLERRETFVYVGRRKHRNVWEIYKRGKCSAVLTLLLLPYFWFVEAKFSVLLVITELITSKRTGHFNCVIKRPCLLLTLYSVANRYMSLWQWWNDTERRTPIYSERRLCLCQFVHHKSNTVGPGINNIIISDNIWNASFCLYTTNTWS